MSYRGILTSNAHALATAWTHTIGTSHWGVVLGRDIEVGADEAAAVVAGLASTGLDVADLGVASMDELAYVSEVLALPAVHLGQDAATGLGPRRAPFALADAPGPRRLRVAERPGNTSTDDLTDDYVAHLRALAPLHGIRRLDVAVQASGTSAGTVPLALADSTIRRREVGEPADLTLVLDPTGQHLAVRDERGRLVRSDEVSALLAHHQASGAAMLFGVPSPLLLARTLLSIVGHRTQPLSELVADAVAHRETLDVPVSRFDEAARAVERAFARLTPTRRPGDGLQLAGYAGVRGEWTVSLRRQPDTARALLVVQAADAPLRAALRDDARSILKQFAPAA